MKLLKRIQVMSHKTLVVSTVGIAAINSLVPLHAASTTATTTSTVTNMPPVLPDDTMPQPPNGERPEPPDGQTPPGGFNVENGSSVESTGMILVDGEKKTISNQTVTATTSNTSTVKVLNAGTVTISNATLNKATGEMTVEEASDFFGANAGVLATSSSTINIDSSTINTKASGANALFSTGDKTVINVSNTAITTTENNSRGLDATFNGTINADKVTINTAGNHCAAVATDRGEGTITVKNSALNTNGDGSPCIYSTGNITASNSTGLATNSPIAVIEGKNSITLNKSNLSGYAIGRGTGGIDNTGVMIYQSMSGDATTGTGTFTSTDSTLQISSKSKTYKTAPMFLITNTNAAISLTNTNLIYGSGTLINALGNNAGWGKVGSNGGNLTFKASSQTLKGNILCDSISTIALSLSNTSHLKGSIDQANTGTVSISLDKTSQWTLTGTSYIASIVDADTKLSNINSCGYNIYYDASNKNNAWLAHKTVTLNGGGKLIPLTTK